MKSYICFLESCYSSILSTFTLFFPLFLFFLFPVSCHTAFAAIVSSLSFPCDESVTTTHHVVYIFMPSSVPFHSYYACSLRLVQSCSLQYSIAPPVPCHFSLSLKCKKVPFLLFATRSAFPSVLFPCGFEYMPIFYIPIIPHSYPFVPRFWGGILPPSRMSFCVLRETNLSVH